MAKKEFPLAIVTGAKPLVIPNFGDNAEYAAAEAMLQSLEAKAAVNAAELARMRSPEQGSFQHSIEALASKLRAGGELQIPEINQAVDKARGLELTHKVIELAIADQKEALAKLRDRLDGRFRPQLLAALKEMTGTMVEHQVHALEACAEIMKLRQRLQNQGYAWPLASNLMVPGLSGLDEAGAGIVGSCFQDFARDGMLTGKEPAFDSPVMSNAALYVRDAVEKRFEQQRQQELAAVEKAKAAR